MRNIDALYIHPSRRMDCSMYNIIPVGVVGLMNLLRARGYSIRGVNYGLEKQLDPRFRLETWLACYRPNIIFIELHWYEHAYGAIEAARICKSVHPEAHVVLGGMTASFFSREILRMFHEVDFILRGDCEVPIIALTDAILQKNGPELEAIPNLTWRKKGMLIENEQSFILRSFEGIDAVSIDFLQHWPVYYHMSVSNFSKYEAFKYEASFWLPIARGCQFNCCFCGGGYGSQSRIYKRDKLIVRSLEDVHSDLLRLVKLGLTRVNLSHDPASIGELYWREFFNIVKGDVSSLGVYLEFFQIPNISFLDTLFETFDVNKSILIFTPISGNERARSQSGKRFTNEQFLRILEHCKYYRVKIGIYFTSNLPFDDLETFQESIDLARTIVRMYPPDRLLFVLNQPIALDPSCPMYLNPAKYGIVRHFTSFKDYYDYSRGLSDKLPHSNDGFSSMHISHAKLSEMHNRWDIEIEFERIQRFPWHEVAQETTSDGIILSWWNRKTLVDHAAGDLLRFLRSVSMPISLNDVVSSWPKDLVIKAVKQLSDYVIQYYEDKRRLEYTSLSS